MMETLLPLAILVSMPLTLFGFGVTLGMFMIGFSAEQEAGRPVKLTSFIFLGVAIMLALAFIGLFVFGIPTVHHYWHE